MPLSTVTSSVGLRVAATATISGVSHSRTRSDWAPGSRRWRSPRRATPAASAPCWWHRRRRNRRPPGCGRRCDAAAAVRRRRSRPPRLPTGSSRDSSVESCAGSQIPRAAYARRSTGCNASPSAPASAPTVRRLIRCVTAAPPRGRASGARSAGRRAPSARCSGRWRAASPCRTAPSLSAVITGASTISSSAAAVPAAWPAAAGPCGTVR